MRTGARSAVAVLLSALATSALLAEPESVDVPLSLWTDATYPLGLALGGTMGVSWGDYDGDGYIDIFACFSGSLWHNVRGVTWEFARDLDSLMPPAERRYGSSFGDYDNDGFPDIATAPRVPAWGDDRLHLLRSLGGEASFADVADDRSIVDEQPHGNAETLCWADVDVDGRLDLFVPVYPPWVSGPGNFFLFNIGPDEPGGPYRFTESSRAAGLDNPPGTSRPEGAQFADVDSDGDVDLFSNGTLYRNVSSPGIAKFHALSGSASGIGLGTSLDEGAMFFDYDLDGDQDLFVVYTTEGVRIWENYGDGTFFAAEPGIVDSPLTGLNLGMSAEDWDNDGDIDFSTRQVFRRNRLVEERARHFTVATHSIAAEHLTSATPAWGDWDKDGDLDCAVGNWGLDGHLYENTLYTPATPPADRRHVRVRVVRNAPAVARGLEVEYGATAEVFVLNVPDSYRRKKFVASSHGYLNQNEYTLHFALPPDPAVGNPAEDVRFDLSVDFPSLPADGTWRVDKRVNPVLGDMHLASLDDREIQVYRCGQIVIGGTVHEPIPLVSPRLTTTTGGLPLPEAGPPPAPTPSPGPDWYTGLAFDTLNATGRLVVEEIILDGQLDAPRVCGSTFNIALWDVTDPGRPVLVTGSALREETSSRNRRSTFPTDIVLEPGRQYRLVARVKERRETPIDAPVLDGPITVRGGILYRDTMPCWGQHAASATVDGTVSLSFRFGFVPPSGPHLDPVGSTLRLDQDAGGRPVLHWLDVSAPGYQVLRCSAFPGPCTPTLHGTSTASTYVDPDASGAPPAGGFWYLVKAVNECTAGLSAP